MSQGGKPKVDSHVVHGGSDTLLLDLDTEESVKTFVLLLPMVEELYPLRRGKLWPSASKGTHAEVTFWCGLENTFGVQAILGSDGVREMLSLREFMEGDTLDVCNILFKPKRCACGGSYLSVREPVRGGEGDRL